MILFARWYKAATTIGFDMKIFRRGLFLFVLALTALAGGAPALAQLHGDDVLRTGTFNDDVFVSGSHVTIRATVNAGVIAMGSNVNIRSQVTGDVVTAGAKVTVGDQIGGDVLAAAGAVRAKGEIAGEMTAVGGDVELKAAIGGDVLALGGKVEAAGRIDGDVKLAGGRVEAKAQMGGNLMMAGGRLILEPGAVVKGKTWAVGGRIEIDGRIEKELRAAGRRVIISGEVLGNVHVDAIEFEILSGTKIHGKLFYRAPHKAEIQDGATILGDVTFVQSEQPSHMVGTALAAAGGIVLLLLVALTILGAAQVLLFPEHSIRSARLGRASPWRTFAIGFAVLIATPIAAVILFSTVIGIPLGLVLLAAYLVLASLGLGNAALLVGRQGLVWLGRNWDSGAWGRIGLVVVGLLIIAIVGLIPVLGAIAVLAAISIGIGASAVQLARHRTA
jgi:hypothetical protein